MIAAQMKQPVSNSANAVGSPTSARGLGRGGGGQLDSDDDEPTVALSRHWQYQRQSRTWSRVVDDRELMIDDDEEDMDASVQNVYDDANSNNTLSPAHTAGTQAHMYDYGEWTIVARIDTPSGWRFVMRLGVRNSVNERNAQLFVQMS